MAQGGWFTTRECRGRAVEGFEPFILVLKLSLAELWFVPFGSSMEECVWSAVNADQCSSCQSDGPIARLCFLSFFLVGIPAYIFTTARSVYMEAAILRFRLRW